MSSPINIPGIQGGKKVFLLWFCPLAIVHILSVSDFTEAETQVWIPERLSHGIAVCLSWCYRHWVVTDFLIHDNLDYKRIHSLCWEMCTYRHRHDVRDSGSRGRQRKKQICAASLWNPIRDGRKRQNTMERRKRVAALPVLSVLKGNEKTLNRSQLTGLLLRDNQMENEAQKTPPQPELHKALHTLRAWSRCNYTSL